MTDAGIIAIVSGYVSMVGVIAWLVYSRIAAANAMQAMDDERDKAIVRAERAEYELTKRDEKIANLERTVSAMAKEPREKPNSDLPLDADDERMRRAGAEAVASAGGSIPPRDDGHQVHPPSAGSDSAAAEVRTAGPGDRLLDLDEHLL